MNTDIDRRNRGGRTGFTLVELLVVISVMVVMLAMVVPVIGIVRRNAQVANCASNLHQLGAATLAYINDNRQLPPPIFGGNWTIGNLSSNSNSSGQPVGPAHLIQSGYVEDYRIIYCPGVGRGGTDPGSWIPADWSSTYSSYCWWAGYNWWGGAIQGMVQNVNDPTTLILATDFIGDATATYRATNHQQGIGPGSRGGNLLYYDGHVDWKPFSSVQVQQDYYMHFCF